MWLFPVMYNWDSRIYNRGLVIGTTGLWFNFKSQTGKWFVYTENSYKKNSINCYGWYSYQVTFLCFRLVMELCLKLWIIESLKFSLHWKDSNYYSLFQEEILASSTTSLPSSIQCAVKMCALSIKRGLFFYISCIFVFLIVASNFRAMGTLLKMVPAPQLVLMVKLLMT